MDYRVVGSPVPRKEGRGKVTGSAEYVDDVCLPGMLHGITVRSRIPRGHITNIEFLDGVPWDEFVVVTAADIPGKNIVSLIAEDQPYLAEKQINHSQEPILLLAHEDKNLLQKAREHVLISYDALPAVVGIDESLSGETVIWGENNVFKQYMVEKGDVDSVWSSAALVVEGEYTTGAQEQLYIETNGMIASIEDGAVVVRGSMQCPYYVHKALTAMFNLPADKVRVMQQETAVRSAVKKNIHPSSPAMPRCWRGSPAEPRR